jgi:hypothetical protein
MRTTAYVGFAVAGAGALTCIITGSIALSKTSQLKSDCPGSVCPASRQGDISSAKNFAGASTVSLALAIVGAGVGVIALVLSRDPHESPRTSSARTRVQPVLGPGAVGLLGRF